MQTQVTFRSANFPACEGEEEEINPGIWGRRLAEYLAAKLAEKGIPTGEPIAEDWGYLVPIPNERFPLAVCCGHQDGDDDEFLVFTEPSTPTVKKFPFRTIDTSPELPRLLDALRGILEADPGIRGVAWR